MNERRGYFGSPWPCEDGGPQRLMYPEGLQGLNIQPGERLAWRTQTMDFGGLTSGPLMVVLREPGEVYVMSMHTTKSIVLGLPVTSRVDRIDPSTLKPVRRSPVLKGGPFWAGGVGVHRNGDLYVSSGRWVHRLSPDCDLKQSYQLPENRPYNTLLFLDNGLIVTKSYVSGTPSVLSVLDPETLEPACNHITMPEGSISRISARGDTVYIVGDRHLFRYHWNESSRTMELDQAWQPDYIGDSGNDYGWDPIIDDHNIWFMDNGRNSSKLISMVNAGVNPRPMHVLRISLRDANDMHKIPISGCPKGASINPPFFSPDRNLLVAQDTPNSHLAAWRWHPASSRLEPLWSRRDFCTGGHMIYYRDSNELILNDYRFLRGQRIVVMDPETGREKASTGRIGFAQGLAFSAPGWGRDFYYLCGHLMARVWVE